MVPAEVDDPVKWFRWGQNHGLGQNPGIVLWLVKTEKREVTRFLATLFENPFLRSHDDKK